MKRDRTIVSPNERHSRGRASVRRRQVFYIPGYDPFHPRRYRELYRKEAKAQADISGYDIALTQKTTPGPFGWHVTAQIDGVAVAAEMSVLMWSDIVKHSMGHTILATYGAMIRTAWTYLRTGALFRLMRLRKGPVIAALYPVVMLILQLIAALAIGYGVGLSLFFAVDWSLNQLTPDRRPALLEWATATLVGAAATWGILSWFKRLDAKFYVYYLMHDYSYAARHLGAIPADLEDRMALFGDHIARALARGLESDTDEVLVVGHSSGAHIAISVLADLIRANRVPAHGPALSFLSLGHVVPMVSFLPKAHRLRRDLHDLSQSDALTWIDVTAPGDGCAFALCDPVAVSGVAPSEGKRWPIVFSAAFTQSLSPARWKALRWRFFRLHFQYLCAFDAPKDYDYFQITAGPQSLTERYGARAPSKSRIEKPVNRFTGMA